jgi:hypothetical protein
MAIRSRIGNVDAIDRTPVTTIALLGKNVVFPRSRKNRSSYFCGVRPVPNLSLCYFLF